MHANLATVGSSPRNVRSNDSAGPPHLQHTSSSSPALTLPSSPPDRLPRRGFVIAPAIRTAFSKRDWSAFFFALTITSSASVRYALYTLRHFPAFSCANASTVEATGNFAPDRINATISASRSAQVMRRCSASGRCVCVFFFAEASSCCFFSTVIVWS